MFVDSYENMYRYLTIYLIFLVPYTIYELIQIKKDDIKNKTNLFKQRIYLTLFVLVLFVTFKILFF